MEPGDLETLMEKAKTIVKRRPVIERSSSH